MICSVAGTGLDFVLRDSDMTGTSLGSTRSPVREVRVKTEKTA